MIDVVTFVAKVGPLVADFAMQSRDFPLGARPAMRALLSGPRSRPLPPPKRRLALWAASTAAVLLASIVSALIVVRWVTPPPSIEDMMAQTRQSYDGPLEMGEDLMSFDIGAEAAVHRRKA